MDSRFITVDTRHWRALNEARDGLRRQAVAGADLVFAQKTLCYVEEGYASILTYARRELGIDPVSAARILELVEAFRHLPRMRRLLETGEAHWAVLSAVADVVTPATDADWADLCYRFHTDLPLVETLVRDWRSGALRFDEASEAGAGDEVPPDTPLH